MPSLVVGLFTNSQKAGKAIASLKEKGYTDDISVIAKNQAGEISEHQVKDDIGQGMATGMAVGAPLGALAGLIVGTVSIPITGALLIIAGPLTVAWGLTGAAVGALGGGLVGALVKTGVPEEKAKQFENHIMKGEVLVTIDAKEANTKIVERDLHKLGAYDIYSLPDASQKK